MVDSINNNGINETLLNIGQQSNVEKVNKDSSETANVPSLKLLDSATISDEAKRAYESEKETIRFSRLAQRVKEPFDNDKVAYFKNMLDSGRINDYLRSVNTDELAGSMLKSAGGAFLR